MPRRGPWPENPVIYQVYPRSFLDTTGTGEGDLPGVTRQLDYIAGLGVDGIWLSPFYPSPFCDGGYDIADHCAVDRRFGTLDDFDALVARAHDLDLRVMIDLVLNHTSDTHDWFAKSLAREEGFEDVYIWADPCKDGSPPSNWLSFFGEAAWRWHPQRAQYCLHKFLPCQPCLNHYNDRVHERLNRITRFWRDRGVDGFRYDAVTSFFYDPGFRDNPPAAEAEAALIPGPSNNPYTFQEHIHDVLPNECAAFAETLREMAGPDAYLLGEINNGPRSVEVTCKFTGPDRLDAGYAIDLPERGPSTEVLRDLLTRLEDAEGWTWWLNSHDQKRAVSSFGDGGAADAKMLAAFLCALPGPLLLFQGEELGQPQAELEKVELTDPYDLMYWPDSVGRNGARAPMAWDDTQPACGFSKAVPWLPMARAEQGGVAQQEADPASVLAFYRDALARRRDLGLAEATMELEDAPDACIRFRLRVGTLVVQVAANMSGAPQDLAPRQGAKRILQTKPPAPGSNLPPRSAAWWLLEKG
ncbi:alpha amylase catalytic region (plasmid) [Dinoroseobacter shibae DFL 12 = DSM 16493]|jgi:alpha-glucosidase|uniref:Alpha amylase catalytic region n=1 Tax=Dinoroseobacter shibae (strain DSM 16493 / NCIMB 14021 / DFL 12) TaxID=398580 RepID=A8LTQ9_DINSH|nr:MULTISPECIES: alpha-amylase family glycosyl hydrolase [Dinoroseobacter]ABV95626.1 alpha amylase catalytic region [Dinoroseobacter shibae DFL 12 = DSM 16493]MDD9719000.1 alpha-amylase family glycosyl hydrolase [Dinoroseobacter sp. PD6]URF48834.1 alpha-amylase family glycosyl hydrolase [Dinoroseobacter shibae]URF53146.1 alpha-amylase family glycosyl hydrolase [Dinoroseobacter shibae]